MADTGLPWELPYPLPTDLVRDGADDIKDLAEAVAAGLDEAGNAGIGSNVVSAAKTDQFSSTSTSPEDIPGLSVTITPSSTDSKILLIAQLSVSGSYPGFLFSGGNTGAYIGDADGSRTRTVFGLQSFGIELIGNSMVYLDSPNTTDPVTYTCQIRMGGGAPNIGNVNFNDSNINADRTAGASSLTAIEVAA